MKQLVALGTQKISYIIATARQPENAVELIELSKKHANLSVLKLDVKNYQEYDDFYNQVSSIVGDKGVQLLINNAGILIVNTFEEVTRDQMVENFEGTK